MNAVNAIDARERRGTLRFADLSRAAAPKVVPLLPCITALLGVFACTLIFFRWDQHLGSVGFLYLVFVVLAAVRGGFWQATLVSVVAVACLDYYFDEPIFSFTVGRVSNWVELGAFELTALVISQLSNRARAREAEAVAERRDTERLYDIARQILLSDSPTNPGDRVTALIRETFELQQVALFDAVSGRTYYDCESASEPGRERMIEWCREAHQRDSEMFEPAANTRVCALRFGARPDGALALSGTQVRPLMATAVASLAAIALERARTLEKQFEAEGARQAEQLRTAVLDSLAHKFKTPLTVIRTASSGLPAVGALSEPQRELVSLIDQEAKMLNDLASRLMGAPSLDVKEFQPQPEPVLFSRLVKAAIQELDRESDRNRFQISLPPSEPAVFADRELILTALAQIVDNALKYSAPDSPIEAGIHVADDSVVLRVRTKGLVVSAADQDRIFERFYRAPGAQEFSGGTGLGLSIVKTIAADHEGKVWAEGEPDYGTVFSFALPVVLGVVHEQ